MGHVKDLEGLEEFAGGNEMDMVFAEVSGSVSLVFLERMFVSIGASQFSMHPLKNRSTDYSLSITTITYYLRLFVCTLFVTKTIEMPLEVQEIVQEIDGEYFPSENDDSRHDSFEEQEYNRNFENEVIISSLHPSENNEHEFEQICLETENNILIPYTQYTNNKSEQPSTHTKSIISSAPSFVKFEPPILLENFGSPFDQIWPLHIE